MVFIIIRIMIMAFIGHPTPTGMHQELANMFKSARMTRSGTGMNETGATVNPSDQLRNKFKVVSGSKLRRLSFERALL